MSEAQIITSGASAITMVDGRTYEYALVSSLVELNVRWPDPALRSSKVAIIGFATESRYDAPYDDPDCEIWGLNMAEGWMLLEANAPGRLDRLWELHDRATLEHESTEQARSVDHLAWL